MLKGVIIIGLHSSDREALDELQAGLEFPDTVLDLAVGPGQGGERVLHLPHSGQEVIRGREAGGDPVVGGQRGGGQTHQGARKQVHWPPSGLG